MSTNNSKNNQNNIKPAHIVILEDILIKRKYKLWFWVGQRFCEKFDKISNEHKWFKKIQKKEKLVHIVVLCCIATKKKYKHGLYTIAGKCLRENGILVQCSMVFEEQRLCVLDHK